MNKTILLCLLMIPMVLTCDLFSQDPIDREQLLILKNQKINESKELKEKLSTLEGEINAITENLIVLPYWDKGARGLFGIDLSSFNNWATRGQDLNSTASNIGISFNGFANKIATDYFWRNNGSITFGWQKFKRNEDDNSGFRKTADIFNIQSLYGRYLNKKLAISTLAEIRTTFLENSFDPAYIDLGMGFTWTPIKNFVAVLHPLNQNIVIASKASTFKSSLGSKIVIDYSQDFSKNIAWRSNLSAFVSYKDADGLSNYTWMNRLNINAVKKFGFGVEFAIRKSNQETRANPEASDGIQTYLILGISYNI